MGTKAAKDRARVREPGAVRLVWWCCMGVRFV
jgi:hypothetical protein